jgi:hypothetical protein
MKATYVTLLTTALSIAALPGAASNAPSGVRFKASVTTVTTDARGRMTEEPTVLVDTITNGRIARTEILRGNKGVEARDVRSHLRRQERRRSSSPETEP